MSKRIGILTGGGNVPGLNAVIKSVVYRATENQCEVIGIRKGWEGLTHCNLDDPASQARYIWPLDRANTRTIDRSGGTVLHTSRISPSRIRRLPEFLPADGVPRNGEWFDLTQHAVSNLDLSVSNSLSGRRWKLDHAPAVGDPTHMVEFGTGRRAFAREA